MREELYNFCKNVTQIRKNYALSKKEMSKILGIGVRSLSMIENNIIPKRLNCLIIVRVCESFKITPKDLLETLIDEI